MPATVIRPACIDDAEALAALGRSTFVETFVEGFGIPYPADDLRAYLDANFGGSKMSEHLRDPAQAWWVAERDGALGAFANTGPCGLPHPDVRPTHSELRRLYVAKSAQGLGLGTELLARALAWMDAHTDGPEWIGVWSGNAKALKLYAAHGFTKAGGYKFPVGNWFDDEVILRR